jgi:hypothetical protein
MRMLAEVTEAVAEAHGFDFAMAIEVGVVLTNVLLFLATIITAIYMRNEAIRHRLEAQTAHNRHEETIVGGIEDHDERELMRMAQLIEKVIDDQKTDRDKVVDDGVPNLRSA